MTNTTMPEYEFVSLRVTAALKAELLEISIEEMEPLTQTCIRLMRLGLTAYYAQQEAKSND